MSTATPNNDIAALREQITTRFPKDGHVWSEFRGQHRLRCAPDKLLCLMGYLRDSCGFDQLSDVTAVDYLEWQGAVDRFEVIYCLLSTTTGQRLIVHTPLNEPDLVVPSMYDLWFGADWLEREVYDMYGIVFDGHPNPKRLLLPEQFAAFPLRKDYPVKGRGERHNFPVITRSES